MAKKKSVSSLPAKRTKKKKRPTIQEYDRETLMEYFLKSPEGEYKPVRDEDIDYSDIPELDDETLGKGKRAKPGRPALGVFPRKMISIKIDPILLLRLRGLAKEQGKGYQSLMHEILEKHVEKYGD